jgi:predicted small lipoprotein YifL
MRCWAQYLLWAVIAILGSGSLLSACGQKGDLYLPDPAEQSDEKKKEMTSP